MIESARNNAWYGKGHAGGREPENEVACYIVEKRTVTSASPGLRLSILYSVTMVNNFCRKKLAKVLQFCM